MAMPDESDDVTRFEEGGGKDGGLNSVERVRRKRKGGQKVRSACITCKIRRVKCDETHPACQRCINYWGHCEGYAKPKKSLGSSFHVSNARTILPQNSEGPNLREKRDLAVAEANLRQPYHGPVFESVDEYNGFKTFLSSTSLAFAGAFDGPIWTYHLPRQASTEPFIRCGVAALGSMTALFKQVMRERMNGIAQDSPENCLGSSPAYTRTLNLYAKCLQHMRTALAKPNRSIRDTLLGCLLVVGFEGFHGFHYSALLHAQNGLKLFYEWLSEQPCVTSKSDPFRSPNPNDLEEDLVHSLLRLDFQVVSFFDTRSGDDHTQIAKQGEMGINSMPSTFLSLHQARAYWDMISRRICHFIASILSTAGASSDALMLYETTEPFPKELGIPNGIKLFGQSSIILTGYEEERAKYTADIEAWEQAFKPLYKHLVSAKDSQFHGAAILSMQAKMLSILLAGAFFSSEMDYDSLTPTFRSIVSLATSIWSKHTISANIGVSYNFDLGLLPPLFLVGTRCRDRVIRREAISLLLTDFHRENMWDSFGIALISRWVMGMEESGVSADQRTGDADFIYGSAAPDSPPTTGKAAILKCAGITPPPSAPSTTSSIAPGDDEQRLEDCREEYINPADGNLTMADFERSTNLLDHPCVSEEIPSQSQPNGYDIIGGPPTPRPEAAQRVWEEMQNRDLWDTDNVGAVDEILTCETSKVQTTAEALAHCARVGLGQKDMLPVPESRRLRITGFNVELNLRKAQLEYIQGPVGGSGRVQKKRHVVLW